MIDLSRAAVHEAGHAVVCHLLGYPATHVIVRPDGTGNTRHVWPQETKRTELRAWTAIAMSGSIAESLLTGREDHTGEWATDILNVAREQSRMVVYGMTSNEARREMQRIADEVRHMLEQRSGDLLDRNLAGAADCGEYRQAAGASYADEEIVVSLSSRRQRER